jgi:hypothetical protein
MLIKDVPAIFIDVYSWCNVRKMKTAGDQEIICAIFSAGGGFNNNF